MSRLSWLQYNNTEYSQDPHHAGVLLDALNNRNIADFRYALEVMSCDPNLLDASTGLSIFQAVLQTPKSVEYIKLCINNGADLYDKNSKNRFPIHFAAFSKCPENMEAFLKNCDPSKVNLKHNGQNCLHYLIGFLTNKNYANISQCIKLLLNHGCSPNLPDNTMRTPFYMLVSKQNEIQDDGELVKYFMNNAYIEFHTYKSPEIIKLVEAQYPNYNIPPPSKSINLKFMITLLDTREELDFDIYYFAFKEATDEDFADCCLKFFEIAVANGMKDTVQFLLEKRVNVNEQAIRPKYLKPPAFVACSNGYFRILEMLLKRGELKFHYQNGTKKYTLLHEICQNYSPNIKNNKKVDFEKCFDMVLKDKRCDVNAEDDLSCTALHYTVKYKNEMATIALLKKGAFINEESCFGKTPIDEITCATLEKFLDECITTSMRKDSDSKIVDIQIDYNFLIAPNRHRQKDTEDDDEYCKEIASLKRIADNEELKHLVSHPVLSSFLLLKWSKLSMLFYTNLALFSIFMSAFVIFLVLSQQHQSGPKDASLVIFEWIYFVSICMLTLREIFQCALSFKTYYRSFINWFEIGLIILSWVVFTSEFSWQCEREYQSIMRAFLVLGAACEFLHIIGTLPMLSLSTHMVILKRVSLTFLKSIALYSIILVSFGLSFYMVFNGTEPKSQTTVADANATLDNQDFKNFDGAGISIVRVFVMLTGEFDATDMKLDSGAACIIFTMFIFLVTIVLFNLLNALAVSDTQTIKAKGEVIDLIQRIEVLDSYEKVIFESKAILNWRIFPWLRSVVSLFPYTIPKGMIIVRPTKNNEILTFKFTPPGTINFNRETGLDIERLNMGSFRHTGSSQVKSDKNFKPMKYTVMLSSIMKKIRNIISFREEKSMVELLEKKFADDVHIIRNQMNNQMRLTNEILTKQKSQINNLTQLATEQCNEFKLIKDMLMELNKSNT